MILLKFPYFTTCIAVDNITNYLNRYNVFKLTPGGYS